MDGFSKNKDVVKKNFYTTIGEFNEFNKKME